MVGEVEGGGRVVDVAHHLDVREDSETSNELQSPSRCVYRLNRGGAEQIVNLSRCSLCNKPHGMSQSS